MSNEATENTQNPDFEIHRIYTKNISLESPNTPEVFTEQTNPDISIQLSNETRVIEGDIREVTLRVTVTAKINEEKTLFLAEVEQAGIFTLGGFTEEQLGHMEGAYCPNILFPYVRELLDNVITRAGFPPIILAPVNFDLVYAKRLEQMALEEGKTNA